MRMCERCRTSMTSWMMSMFNTDEICLKCKKIEEKHPKYKEACDAEHAAVLAGNTNFPGIGKPEDL